MGLEDIANSSILQQFKTTNFITRPMLVKIVDKIPSLECYKRPSWTKKPLEPKAFQLLIKSIYEGAMRINEVVGLKVKDINFQTNEVTLRETKTGYKICKCADVQYYGGKHSGDGGRVYKIVKGDKKCKECLGKGKLRIPQFTSFPAWLTKEIAAYVLEKKLKNEDYLFSSPSFHGKHISSKWAYNQIRELTNLCDFKIYARNKIKRIENLYTHIFRKSKAKQMLLDGFTLGEVSKKLRHQDVSITTTYILAEFEDLANKERELELKSFSDYKKTDGGSRKK